MSRATLIKQRSFTNFLMLFMICFFLAGCSAATTEPALLQITIIVDGASHSVFITPGLTVDTAVLLAGLTMETPDRIDPPLTTVIQHEIEIRFIRLIDKFIPAEIVLPFETRTNMDEILQEDQSLLAQAGLFLIRPYQTNGDWTWSPSLFWSPGGEKHTVVTHGSTSSQNEDSQVFSLTEVSPELNTSPKTVIKMTGMFVYPIASPSQQSDYSWVDLLSNYPEKSETGFYDVYIVHQIGSEPQKVFLTQDAAGLKPQRGKWNKHQNGMQDQNIVLIYQGNI